MVPHTGDSAFHETDGEDIDMSGRDLQRVSVMVEKFRMSAIEGDMVRSSGASVVPGHCPGLLKQGVGHSWATSLA